MNAIKGVLQHTIPQYLETLPLPDKFSGFAELTLDEWIALGPLITFGLLLLTFIAQGFTSSAPKDSEWVNKSLHKELPKAVVLR